MKDGIYHVTFSSNTADFGEGIAVFKGDSVNGGDTGYLYFGKKMTQDGQFTSRLTIKRWNPSAHSIFGSIDQFELELSGGSPDPGTFVATGHVVGQPQAKITIRGRYLAPAA